jgi:hypothetical protein
MDPYFCPDLPESRSLVIPERYNLPAELASPTYGRVKSEILQIGFQISDLEREITRLKATYSHRAWQISPVRRLPFKLLGRIFCHLVGITPGSFLDDTFCKALLFTCVSWKEVAESMPEIWTTIDIQLEAGEFDFDEPRWSRERVNRWMGRASNRAVNIRIASSTNDHSGMDLHDRLNTLGGQLQRWKALVVEGGWATQIVRGSLSSQSAIYDDSNPHSFSEVSDVEDHPVLGKCHSMQALETLSWSGGDNLCVVPKICIVAQNLSTLSFHQVNIYLHYYSKLAQGAPNVKNVSFTQVEWVHGSDDEAQQESSKLQLGHRHLQSLTFHAYPEHRFEPLFRTLARIVANTQALQNLFVYCQPKRKASSSLFRPSPILGAIESLSSIMSSVTTLDIHLGVAPERPNAKISQLQAEFLGLFVNAERLTVRAHFQVRDYSDSDTPFEMSSSGVPVFGAKILPATLALNKLRSITFCSIEFMETQLIAYARKLNQARSLWQGQGFKRHLLTNYIGA